ncbi:MAG: tyrosine-type recombinase/integrase [Gemmataceae bacterium]
MASLIKRKNGTREIQFKNPITSKPSAVRLGHGTLSHARTVKSHVEELISAKIKGARVADETCRWLRDKAHDDLHRKLEQVGLVEPRAVDTTPTIGEYAKLFLDSKPHIKASTRRTFKVALDRMTAAIGPELRLSAVTEEMVLSAIHRLKTTNYSTKPDKEKKYSAAFIAKLITIAKAMFRMAVRRGVVAKSPLEYVVSGSQVNKARNQFIPAETVRKLIESLTDVEWKLAVALARWGGLRIPSELFALKWDHILWDQDRIILPTPKLEHLPGRESRLVPIFPEIKPFLDAAWDALGDKGAVYLTPRLRTMSGNLGTMLDKFIRRAGLETWPRTFQNLRASRATELADLFPSHVAAAWLGHTSEIADKHYRSVTEEHFAKAVQGAVKSAVTSNESKQIKDASKNDKERKGSENSVPSAPSHYLHNRQVGATGFEPVTPRV